jgi:hypothetical protein
MNEEKFSQYENINLDNLMNEEGSLILGEFIVNDYSCMAYYESEFGVTGNLISANNMTNIY